MRKPTVILAGLVALIAAGSIWFLVRDNPEIELVYRLDCTWLDRQIEVTRRLPPEDSDGKAVLEKELERLESTRREVPRLALHTIRQRIIEAGVKGAEIELFDNDRRLRVLLPSLTPLQCEKVKRYIQTLGRLSFHLVASEGSDDEIIRRVLDPGNPQHSYGGYELYYMEHKAHSGSISREAIVVRTLPLVDGSQVDGARAASDGQGGWQIRVVLNASAAVRFEEVTAANVGRRLAIVMDGECFSAPMIQERVAGELCISGSFTEFEAQELAAVLRFRMPPVDLIPESERSLKHPEQEIAPPTAEDSARITAEELIAEIRVKAEQGDADAQLDLSSMYASGRGVPVDNAEAARWCRKAADKGNADAQHILGFMHTTGEGVAKDHAEAMKWFSRAADQGHARAQYDLGLMYYHGEGVPKDSAEAAKWYRKAADQGHARAQSLLGTMYFRGIGVPKNDIEAVKWIRKAAEQGDVFAQNALGLEYLSGTAVPKDNAEAVKWVRKAAEQGLASAQYMLGIMHADGTGVAKDVVQAHVLLSIAMAKGHKDAKEVLAEIEIRMTTEEIAKATELAKELSTQVEVKPAKDAEEE